MMKVKGFDWDNGNWIKCAKHGVSHEDIETVITRARFVIDDPSEREKRFRTVGKTANGRYVFVVFTIRPLNDGNYCRPISARYMHQKEIESYEKEMARLEE